MEELSRVGCIVIAFEDTEMHKGTLGSGNQGLKHCLIDIAETLADSLACSPSIKIFVSMPDRVITICTCSLRKCF